MAIVLPRISEQCSGNEVDDELQNALFPSLPQTKRILSSVYKIHLNTNVCANIIESTAKYFGKSIFMIYITIFFYIFGSISFYSIFVFLTQLNFSFSKNLEIWTRRTQLSKFQRNFFSPNYFMNDISQNSKC